MSREKDFKELMELYDAETFETHHKAARMQLAIEKKDVSKLIEFLQKINK